MKPVVLLTALLAAGLYLGLSGAIRAQQPGRRTTPDAPFLQQAALANAGQIELGKLARDRARTRDVRDLAQRLVNDHTRANKELLNLGDIKGLNLPTRPDRKHRALKDRLSDLRGIEFDLDYLRRVVVPDLVVLVGKYQAEANNGLDTDVRNYANKTLPILRDDLERARAVAQRTRPEPGSP